MCDSDGEERIIIPPGWAVEVVRRSGKVYVRECPCRAAERLCPPDTWEVCLLLEDAPPDKLRSARRIPAGDALAILEETARREAIYHLFYTHGSGRATEICSCCTCCCHPLREVKEAGDYAARPRSEYVAVTDAARCVGCGECVAHCFFEARRVEEGALHLADERCFGCGRCAAACPQGAIRLERQAGRGVPLAAIYPLDALGVA
jgi:Pyruvate/2-oxoacid:ferredoxin oxidoreductase delta subunit